MSPHLGASVTLVGDDGEAITSIVVFADDHQIYLAVPQEWGERPRPEGVPFELSWPGDNGAHVVPVAASTEEDSRGKWLWKLIRTGDHRFDQRRLYVRVAVRGAMTIANLVGDTGESERATLLDVSETSLCCAVPDVAWLDAGAKTPVRVRFTVADNQFATNGEVLRSTRIGSEHNPKGARVVVLFEHRMDFANRLRRAVFEEQRRRIAEERELIERNAPPD